MAAIRSRRRRSLKSRIRRFLGLSHHRHKKPPATGLHSTGSPGTLPKPPAPAAGISSGADSPQVPAQHNAHSRHRSYRKKRGLFSNLKHNVKKLFYRVTGKYRKYRFSRRSHRTADKLNQKGLHRLRSRRNREQGIFQQLRSWIRKNRTLNDIINSVYRAAFIILTFFMAYFLVWLIYQGSVIFIASFFNIQTVLFYYEVLFTCGNYSPLWTIGNIIAITVSGPLSSLMLGTVAFWLLRKRKVSNPYLHQFVIWVLFISAAHFFGAFISGAITGQGMGYVINWLFMPFLLRLVISLVFLVILAVIGWYSTIFILESAKRNLLKHEKRFFIFRRAFIPWLFATVVLLIVKIPDAHAQHDNIWDYDMFILASVAFAIVPTLFNKKATPKSQLQWPKKIRNHRINQTLWIVAGLVLLLLFRYGLSHGIYVYLKIALNLSLYK